ncbi:Lrp/AsnC family transcriptional regulator [Glutamicibacter sp. PS]|uniref:Lrp/AsnC family transcriptional regulator n=1 Tax=Glutamicibacter TaxID=1742989 RepID=UPI00284E2900|nr:Lrp/AsnC family transcriptional regulator [Glutamicibacter sp. PS]MDR4534373.1 Lrp/AsnC family transcriptional regulator [Glutamicibacter sp. PS]
MTAKLPITLDSVDAALLERIQHNGRQSVAELSRSLNMSHSATAERLRRLEENAVISGYAAHCDPERLGYSIMAFIHLRYPSSNYAPLHELIGQMPEIIEAHHVTGDDCFIMKVIAGDMRHLEQLSGRVGSLGSVRTSVVYSSPLASRALAPRA